MFIIACIVCMVIDGLWAASRTINPLAWIVKGIVFSFMGFMLLGFIIPWFPGFPSDMDKAWLVMRWAWFACYIIVQGVMAMIIEAEIAEARRVYRIQQQEQERQEEERLESLRCKQCGREEAIDLVGQETLSQEQRHETVMRYVNQVGEMPNPNFMGYNPYIGQIPDPREMIPVQSSYTYPEQVVVTYTKVRHVYKCKYCKYKFGVEETLRTM